ncbi:MAG: transcriptional activator NhaR [Pseudomonadota bacterium]|nr:transcriptional activator NhaR [Gammaproteobacteria bacterium]MBU1731431.1 transcriptional activator NhaR [Gammaproteobacteria bacterium]MBU1892936.1 transcriptional activator NhaR [Gammaproteobacteria bacterium]
MLNYRQLYYFWSVAKAGGIARGAEQLHLTPQTISGQISQLEENLGVALFRRVGRRLEPTDIGRLALSYADDIFQVGSELEEILRNREEERPFLFRVGIADVVPKAIAYRLLAPALGLPEPVRLVCPEDKFELLLAELAIHRLDMVLADRPLPPGMDVKGYSHRLGECGLTFFAAPSLAEKLEGGFPHLLDGAPLLIPGEDSAVRAPLLRWLHGQDIHPRIVGEFDDGALMKSFGQAGAGAFPAPTAIAAEVAAQYGVVPLGHTEAVKDRFYLITVERKLSHPAALAVSEAAHQGLFNTPQCLKPAPL